MRIPSGIAKGQLRNGDGHPAIGARFALSKEMPGSQAVCFLLHARSVSSMHWSCIGLETEVSG